MPNEISLYSLSQIIRKERRLLARFVAAFFLVTALVLILFPAIYRPYALIQIENNTNSLSNTLNSNSGMFSGFGSLMHPEASNIQIQMTLMTSPYILLKVIQRLHLDIVVEPQEGVVISDWRVPQEQINEDYQLTNMGGGHYTLYDQSNQEVLSGVVGEPALSKDGSVLLQIDQLNNPKGTRIKIKKKSVTRLLAKLAKDLKITELAVKSGTSLTGSDTGIIEIAMQGRKPKEMADIINAVVEETMRSAIAMKILHNKGSLAAIDSQLPEVKAALNHAETRLSQYQKKSGLIDLSHQSQALLNNLSSTESELLQAKMLKAQMSELYTDNNPQVIMLNKQMEQLKKEDTVLHGKLYSLPGKNQQYMDLVRDVRVYSALYLALLKNKQENGIMLASEASDIYLLEAATVPDAPIELPYLLILIGSVFAGFIIGIVFILTRRRSSLTHP